MSWASLPRSSLLVYLPRTNGGDHGQRSLRSGSKKRHAGSQTMSALKSLFRATPGEMMGVFFQETSFCLFERQPRNRTLGSKPPQLPLVLFPSDRGGKGRVNLNALERETQNRLVKHELFTLLPASISQLSCGFQGPPPETKRD